jgi:Rieske Fe-S protein
MERRKFLQNTCPTVTFAFFGISFIQACSKSGDDMNSYSENYNSNNNNVSNNNSQSSNSSSGSSGTTSSNGISENGNTITLDLTNSTFSELNNPGDFVNLTTIDMLVLKISNSEFRAFDNCCPHSGSKNAWSYANEEFKCNTHGNTYGIDGNNTVNCGSASTSGDLKTYSTSLNNDTLTVTTS